MSAAIEVLAIRRLDGQSSVKAFVNLRLGGVTIKGAKIVQQDGQTAWLAMPSIKTERAWLNVVELSKDLRERATAVVLETWGGRPVSAFIKTPFGELAPYLADYGYQPVPIRPGGKAPLLDDWQAGHPVAHYLLRCARWGTGILTATCPAIDLDIRDRELVRALIMLADEMIGPAPFRIGARPKALLPFSTSEPFDKISGRWFALPGNDWRTACYVPHRIEVLGNGQQFLAYAIHPGTRRPYRWARGEPMQSYRVDLPEIDQGGAQSFLWAAQGVMREAGATALERREMLWFPDPWKPGDSGEPEPTTVRRRTVSGERIDSRWQEFEPERLAKLIDAKHAKRLKAGGWITTCPAHTPGDGSTHRSLSITPRNGGGSVVHCFAECEFSELAREIAAVVGEAA